MKKWLSVWALALLACDGGPTALELCEEISDLSFHSGEELAVEPCFLDSAPPLVYTAESSNPDVAKALVEGERVLIQALQPGEAMITILATDADGLTGEISFLVTIPNREPELVGEPQSIHLIVGERRQLLLSEFFIDPDGQDLTYDVSESDLIEATVSSDTLLIKALKGGDGEFTVTATDGSLSSSTTFSFEVLSNVTIFADGFSDPSGNWTVGEGLSEIATGADISNGVLSVWTQQAGKQGLVFRGVEANDWEIFAELRSGQVHGTFAGLGLAMRRGRYPYATLYLGEGQRGDFVVWVFNEDTGWEVGASGELDADLEDFVDVRWRYKDESYILTFNESEQYVIDLPGADEVELNLLLVIAANDEVADERILLDSINVVGIPPNTLSDGFRDITPFLTSIGERR